MRRNGGLLYRGGGAGPRCFGNVCEARTVSHITTPEDSEMRFAMSAALLVVSACASARNSTPSLCTELCAHAKTCGESNSAFCSSNCGGIREANYSPEAVSMLRECMTGSCNAERAKCFDVVSASLDTRSVDDNFRNDCRTSTCRFTIATCGDANFSEILRPEIVQRLSACLTGDACATEASTAKARSCVFDLLPQ